MRAINSLKSLHRSKLSNTDIYIIVVNCVHIFTRLYSTHLKQRRNVLVRGGGDSYQKNTSTQAIQI